MSVCFIHSCTLPLRGSELLDDLIQKLRKSDILSTFQYVFINNLGTALPKDKYPEPNIKIINSSDTTDMFENATLRLLHFFSQYNPNYKILYLHTKGVGYDKTHIFERGIRDWVNFMLYCLVDKYKACQKLLDYVDVVGCDYRNQLFYENPNHYSGNFWWTTSDYMSKLDPNILKGKYDAEFWLFTGKPTFVNVHTCPFGHYENAYPRDMYEALVEKSLAQQLYIVKNIGQLPIICCDRDVTEICREKLTQDGVLRIPASDITRSEIFLDLTETCKRITINDFIYPCNTDICLRV